MTRGSGDLETRPPRGKRGLPGPEVMAVYSIRLPASLVRAIDARVGAGENRSDVIRRVLQAAIRPGDRFILTRPEFDGRTGR